MNPPFKVEMSSCKRFVRVTVRGESVVLNTYEWSIAIANPGKFMTDREAPLLRVVDGEPDDPSPSPSAA